MRKRAADVIAEGDLSAVVDLAIELNRQHFEAEKELNEVKAYLREVAKQKQHGSAEVELDGLSGTVSVTFPGLLLKPKKGADLKDLEVNLTPESFAKLFFRTIEIKPAMAADDFLEVLATLTPAEQSRVKHFIEAGEQTAKVYVPR
jgi:hypothetical protein